MILLIQDIKNFVLFVLFVSFVVSKNIKKLFSSSRCQLMRRLKLYSRFC
jgi:hypothetical protein